MICKSSLYTLGMSPLSDGGEGESKREKEGGIERQSQKQRGREERREREYKCFFPLCGFLFQALEMISFEEQKFLI